MSVLHVLLCSFFVIFTHIISSYTARPATMELNEQADPSVEQEMLAEGDEGLVTNWVTSRSGAVTPSNVRLFPGNGDGVYEIEYRGQMAGLSIGTDFDSQYLVVQSVSLRCVCILYIHECVAYLNFIGMQFSACQVYSFYRRYPGISQCSRRDLRRAGRCY